MTLPAQISILQADGTGILATKKVPMPKLRDGYLLIRTTAVGLNPIDWKQLQQGTELGSKFGYDYAGIVEEIGPGVSKPFKKGDRIAGLANGGNGMEPEDGSYGEYSVVKAGLAFRIPDNISDVEAAGLSVGIVTAAQGLYQSLKLPLPTHPASEPEYVLIYGGSTPTGILAIQLAKLSGLSVVTTSSAGNMDYVRSFGADAVFEYANADKCVSDIRDFTAGRLRHALDCVSTPETARLCARALASETETYYSALLRLPPEVVTSVNPKIQSGYTAAYTAFGEDITKWGRLIPAKPEDYEFAVMLFELVRLLLHEGKLKPVRPLVNQGGKGLAGVLKGLEDLKAGRVRAAKLIYTL
ncbi:hypothetical protein ACJA88_014533 [Fusarium oxysporum]